MRSTKLCAKSTRNHFEKGGDDKNFVSFFMRGKGNEKNTNWIVEVVMSDTNREFFLRIILKNFLLTQLTHVRNICDDIRTTCCLTRDAFIITNVVIRKRGSHE